MVSAQGGGGITGRFLKLWRNLVEKRGSDLPKASHRHFLRFVEP